MNRAITVKYLGPTNTKGARLVAVSGDTRMVVGYPHGLCGTAVYLIAATELMRREGWRGELHGAAQGHSAMVFVLVEV